MNIQHRILNCISILSQCRVKDVITDKVGTSRITERLTDGLKACLGQDQSWSLPV